VAEAIAFVRAASGSQFDPVVVAAFERVVAERYPELPLDLDADATV
jgi:HD-GYP domain-containing protein (c-di-GMP phosphodiesterase class II)